MSSHSSSIHIMPICILSPVHASVCYYTSLSKISRFLYYISAPFYYIIFMQMHEFVSLCSILLALLHISCIQTAHVLLFRLAHTHKNHHHTSMSSLTISYTLAPTLPSAKHTFLWHIFIFTYSFFHSVSLNPFFHDCLPTSYILSQMYFFHTFLCIFIPWLTIPFTLTSLNNKRFTNSISPNLVHICLNLPQHLD